MNNATSIADIKRNHLVTSQVAVDNSPPDMNTLYTEHVRPPVNCAVNSLAQWVESAAKINHHLAAQQLEQMSKEESFSKSVDNRSREEPLFSVDALNRLITDEAYRKASDVLGTAYSTSSRASK